MRRMVLVWVLVVSCLIAIAGYLKVIDFHMTEPATQVREDWNDLFTQILIIAIIVAVFVWALLIYALVRFRARPGGPKEGPHIHGNVKLEIAWTIAPALVMGWLLVVSFNGLFVIEEPEEQPDFTIKVTGERFAWTFVYPDGTVVTNNTIRVEEGRHVRLELRSKDVIHAFGVPQLAVMKDVVPGRVNYAWFKATQPGEYPFECRELCGVGHSRMGATYDENGKLVSGKIVVFPAGSEPGRMFGFPGAAASPTPSPSPGTPDGNGTQPPTDAVQIRLLSGFRIDPQDVTVELGPEIVFDIKNDDPNVQHNYFIGESFGNEQYASETLLPGQSTTLRVTFESDKTYVVWCDVPGHLQSGMRGTLTAGKGSDLAAEKTPLLPGFEPFVALAAVALAVVVLRRKA